MKLKLLINDYKNYGFRMPFMLLTRGKVGKLLSDKLFLKLRFYAVFGKKLNLKNPRGYNEKIQWLKINDRKHVYTDLVDKQKVKEIVGNIIGREYIIPTISVFNNVNEIDFNKLPESFVLKCTHDSGGVHVVKNKNTVNFESILDSLSQSLNKNFYYMGREWPYKNIKPKIICEELVGDGVHVPEDYKFLCFNGEPDNVMVCLDRGSDNTKYYFYDMKWTLKKYNLWGMGVSNNFFIPKPKNFEKMIEISRVLSNNLPLCRVDLYNINGKIYFGELTLYPDSGFDSNLLDWVDDYFGKKVIVGD